ncbi:hypothetical protein ACOSQ3_032974 [Xanthoceras sorbifolium]
MIDAISSRGAVFLGTRRVGACHAFADGAVDNCTSSPLNSVRSSMLKIDLIPKSEGKSMTYAFVHNFLATLKGPAHHACSLVKLPGGNHSGLRQIRTISPTLNCLSLRFVFAEAAYNSVLRERQRLTSS